MSAGSGADTLRLSACSRASGSRWCGWRQCTLGSTGGSDRQECWTGMGRPRLQHLLSTEGLFGLWPVKPRCSFPQLKPRLIRREGDQSPEGHWRQMRGRPPSVPSTSRMCQRGDGLQLSGFRSCFPSAFTEFCSSVIRLRTEDQRFQAQQLATCN